MQFKRRFSSGSVRFLVLLSVCAVAVAAALYLRFYPQLVSRPNTKIAGAWGVEKSGSGLAVNWNLDAPLFQNALNVTLEIQDGGQQRRIALNRTERTGTLFYTPQATDVTLRLRIQTSTPGEPEKTEVIQVGSQRVASEKPPEIAEKPKPANIPPPESSRARLESPVSIWRVRALAPPALTRKLKDQELEVAVYVKINPAGRVTAASTKKYDDPTEAALASIATRAAMQWKFQPLKGKDRSRIYRDFVIQFKFPKT
jgi:pyruvate/2-oxoglutarate dehydrogenase complex dihydrolipoamide acyltransferase (E2) component